MSATSPSPILTAYISEDEAAAYIGRSKRWLVNQRGKERRGQEYLGPSYRKERGYKGRVLYKKADLDRWLEVGRFEQSPPPAA